MSKSLSVTSLLFVCLMLAAPSAFAGIQIGSTRVVYPVGERSVTVHITNRSDSPRLVKAWVDRDGSMSDAAGDSDAPFVVTPPLSRIDAEGAQALRLAYVGSTEPTDRESIFWLNVLDIPPDLRGSADNTLQFAMRTRIKLFLRPKGLEGSPEKAALELVWRKRVEQGGTYLECSNPSAFHVSLVDVTLPGLEPLRGETIAPHGVCRFRMADPAALDGGKQAVMRSVNDYGALVERQFRLTTDH